ncbi:hypothetical protein BJF81_11630 [Ornithinimicrobium sp. CNJ-824]|nr:hypothetical protein BJF81_11630 [Ornithinimicrobium sp. CNJ-824]
MAFVAGVEVQWIEVVLLHAEKQSVNASNDVEVDIGGGNALAEDHFLSRFEAKASVTDEDGDDVAQLQVALIIKFSSETAPEEDLVERFSRSTGVMMATPYLRENLSSLARRTNVEGVLLPLVRMQGGVVQGDGEAAPTRE